MGELQRRRHGSIRRRDAHLRGHARAQRLQNATRDLDGIARFELDRSPPRRSALREIARLQAAVGHVTASLRSFSRYAPEEIVRDVVVTGREAMLSGERREVSVLFSDLRGFTSFAERLRPEDVVAILNDHFDLLVGIISRHGGFVVDFLGDAVFAVFNAPRTDAAHIEHAVACAIDMQLARTARNEETRARGWPPMEMGVGVDTGPAVVGNMGSVRRIKYGIVGSVVNEAARIETLTVGGQVLIGTAARQALGDRLVVDGPLEVEAKGVADTLKVWDVLGLRGESMRILQSPVRELTPLEPALAARVRLILGKKVDDRSYPASLLRLGAGGAELASEAPLSVFGPLQLLLPERGGGGAWAPLDGKVVALSDHEGARTALVRFTGLGWDARERVEAFAVAQQGGR